MKYVIALLLLLSIWNIYAAEISPQRQDELLHLLRHDCGSCHGMTLQGGLGPPLLPQTLVVKPEAVLLSTLLEGREGTPMPPWRDFLTPAEARWLIKQLLEGINDTP